MLIILTVADKSKLWTFEWQIIYSFNRIPKSLGIFLMFWIPPQPLQYHHIPIEAFRLQLKFLRFTKEQQLGRLSQTIMLFMCRKRCKDVVWEAFLQFKAIFISKFLILSNHQDRSKPQQDGILPFHRKWFITIWNNTNISIMLSWKVSWIEDNILEIDCLYWILYLNQFLK